MEHVNQKRETNKKRLLIISLILIAAIIILSVIAVNVTSAGSPEVTKISNRELPLAGPDALSQGNGTAGDTEETAGLPSSGQDAFDADDEAVVTETVRRTARTAETRTVQGATFTGETLAGTTPTGPDTENPSPTGPNTEISGPTGPDTENPGPTGPDTENPDSEGPDTENPDSEGLGTENPDSEGPDTENPDSEVPDTDPINVTVNAIEWLTAQLSDPQSDVYQYFDTRGPKSTLDSTGPNFAPTVNEQLRQDVDGIDENSEFSWRIWKEKQNQYNIFWTNEDISKLKKGDEIEDITKCSVDINNPQAAEMTHGTAEVTTSQVSMSDGSKETINTIWGGSFEEDVPETGTGSGAERYGREPGGYRHGRRVIGRQNRIESKTAA